MCVLFAAWRVREGIPLIVAANRDEAYSRPTAPAARWPDCPGVIAGRDLEAGGTWMGVGKGSRWAAVTNIRTPEWMGRKMPGSRGRLVADFLCQDQGAKNHVERVARERGEYGGFNLMVGDADALYYLNRDDPRATRLDAGVYGLSNARLDDPWPKIARGGRAFRAWIEGDLDPEAGLRLLRDTDRAPDDLLPDTGVGIEYERMLSPLFIVGDDYGTRSSTLLIVRDDGSGLLYERTYAQGGVAEATVTFEFSSNEDDGARGGGENATAR